ncbi:PH domain-containing protein [Brachybacterium paraconglomeratum]|uniref:PH domain-containing protein n=1 Tax=Brachybacterium paraconglomeratum TaxID=173362 RepID=UPI0031E741D5
MTSAPDPHELPVEPAASVEARSAGAPAAAAEPARTLSDLPAGLLGAELLRPVSPKLIPARYVGGIAGNVFWLLLIIAAIVGTVLTGWWWIAACGLLPLVIIVQSLLFTPRRVRAIGYLDGEEDLTIASGIMFRSVHTIPYGRVQSVKIGEGPVERRYGLATLTLTTAAGGGTETLPGLPKAEAERLRALLTDRGIELMAAL